MHGIESIAFLLGIALIVVPLAKRSGLPAVIGYLLAGILIGPHVSGLIENTTVVVEIAEYGVAMLLFLIGLELEPSRLWVLRRSVFGLGGLQVLVTTTLLGSALWFWGENLVVCLIAGVGLAMAPPAVALQL